MYFTVHAEVETVVREIVFLNINAALFNYNVTENDIRCCIQGWKDLNAIVQRQDELDSKFNALMEATASNTKELQEMKNLMTRFISGKERVMNDTSPEASISVQVDKDQSTRAKQKVSGTVAGTSTAGARVTRSRAAAEGINAAEKITTDSPTTRGAEDREDQSDCGRDVSEGGGNEEDDIGCDVGAPHKRRPT